MSECCVESFGMKVLVIGWASVSFVALMPASVAWIWKSSGSNIVLRFCRLVNSSFRFLDTQHICHAGTDVWAGAPMRSMQAFIYHQTLWQVCCNTTRPCISIALMSNVLIT